MDNNLKTSPNLITIGIIGGGQLGKMIILEGKKLGIKFIILDPNQKCPASSIADDQIIGDYYDANKIDELTQRCDLITYELEHINADKLIDLNEKGYEIQPSPSTLKMIQNKYTQKCFLKNRNIQTPYFQKVSSIAEIERYIDEEGLPVILKNCYGGYDGKGNKVIKDKEDIEKAFNILDGSNRELMIEKYISFTNEISVIAARNTKGEVKIYPLSENIHKDNILRTTIVPARISEKIKNKAESLALKMMESLDGAGVFCIEMFVYKEDVFINEIAPRVHNSGHYTIEGCNVSQFEQHLRAILGYPLSKPYLIKPSIMINILGEEGKEGKAIIKGSECAFKDTDVYLHFYGKECTKPLRKMGHITILGNSIEEILDKAESINKNLKVTSC